VLSGTEDLARDHEPMDLRGSFEDLDSFASRINLSTGYSFM